LKILITGTAGFIGHSLVKKLTGQGHHLVGLDNINDYYDVNLKYGRLKDTGIDTGNIKEGKLISSSALPDYRFVKMNLEDREGISRLFEGEQFDRVCHLAAQAGVRYSLENPRAYIDSNILGFMTILEACRHYPVDHLAYASSSSVYGLNRRMPFTTADMVDQPVSLYAASKKSCELMAHAYSHLYRIPTTGLRFFTVYGPWGRPDMAAFKFVRAILEDRPIDIYNDGNMSRDFTYIDDIIEGVVRVLERPPIPKSQIRNPKSEKKETEESDGKKVSSNTNTITNTKVIPYKIYNIGRGQPINLMEFITAIEKALGKEAKKNFLPLQKGDVIETWADTAALEADTGYRPTTPVEEGIRNFVNWYRDFYNV
jgi:UDP-glucuronate 4-epimerase